MLGLNHRAENSHQPFRRREQAMQRFRRYEDAAEAQLSSRPGPQSLFKQEPSRQPPGLQVETLGRIGGAVRTCRVDRCLRQRASIYASTNRHYIDNALLRGWKTEGPLVAHTGRPGRRDTLNHACPVDAYTPQG